MNTKMIYRAAAAAVLGAVICAVPVFAQDSVKQLEESVAGIRLGDRESAKAVLDGYGPTFGENGRPTYFFYNKFANQVMKVVARSFDDRFYITEIEVFSVDRSYRRKHFQMKKRGYFVSGKGIFIGYRQSAVSLLSGFAIGVNDPGGKNRVRPKAVRSKLGEPSESLTEGNRLVLKYERPAAVADIEGAVLEFQNEFEFLKKKLKRFRISVSPAAENAERKTKGS